VKKKNKPSILIVEDDINIRETLSSILQQEGYNTDTAKNGKEAIQKSKAKFFNLALLDIKLPDMEGTKLLTTMHENLPKMVKIMITGYPSLENAVEALNLGADAYVIKPVKPEKLLALIEEKLEKQREAEKMTEKKMTEWIKTRVRKLEDIARSSLCTHLLIRPPPSTFPIYRILSTRRLKTFGNCIRLLRSTKLVLASTNYLVATIRTELPARPYPKLKV